MPWVSRAALRAGCLGSPVQIGAQYAHWEAGSEHRPRLCRFAGCLLELEALRADLLPVSENKHPV